MSYLYDFSKNSKEFSESLYFGHQNTWILLFNFQWAVLFAALPCGSQLIYYTTLSFVCQEVFQTFFKFFSSSRLSPTLRCRSLAAPIVYHILPRLSTPFCKFFQDFSIFPASRGGKGDLRWAVIVSFSFTNAEYHIVCVDFIGSSRGRLERDRGLRSPIPLQHLSWPLGLSAAAGHICCRGGQGFSQPVSGADF